MSDTSNQTPANKARVLPTITPNPGAAVKTEAPKVAADPNADKGPKLSFNGQKARTADEEVAAWTRRHRRWHRKALIAIGAEKVKAIQTAGLGWTQEDTKDDK